MQKIRYHKIKFFLIFIAAISMFSGCKVLNPSEMFKTENKYPYNNFEQDIIEYVIRPYDKLNVRIYTNDGIQLIDMESASKISQNTNTISPYLVDHSGLVKVPTLGWVEVAGLTIKEVEKLLEQKYSQYYQSPFVLVNVTNRRVVVFSAGSVTGTVLPIENEQFTLIEAIALAGGIDDFSKAYKIKLLRGELNDPQVYLFDISSIDDMQKANLILQANDIIYVERRPRYVAKTLEELMPYVTLINTFLLLYVTISSLN